ncbi:MAG: hypothetical protein ACLUYK_03815 [Eggerthella lenta]
MTVAENAIVVDKNIWLDFYLHERPLHEDAARFLRVAESTMLLWERQRMLSTRSFLHGGEILEAAST